jgi:TetR/AcrR family transcriptional regulator, mexJK operon transcriptional repressor
MDSRARAAPRVGRPRRGTEAQRSDALRAAATRVFLREGYGAASIDKVAREAGISTRTIYERFRNKADLLVSVITRLVERDMATILATAELERLPLRQALLTIGKHIIGRACDPEAAALFRIVAAEALRFPALAEKMRASTKTRVVNAIAVYFRGQIQRGNLSLADPERAAALFTHMVCAEVHECLMFGSPAEIAKLDFPAHLNQAIDIFLNGAAPRAQAGRKS